MLLPPMRNSHTDTDCVRDLFNDVLTKTKKMEKWVIDMEKAKIMYFVELEKGRLREIERRKREAEKEAARLAKLQKDQDKAARKKKEAARKAEEKKKEKPKEKEKEMDFDMGFPKARKKSIRGLAMGKIGLKDPQEKVLDQLVKYRNKELVQMPVGC